VIASLADAWRWYETARRLARTMERLGKKHWNNLPWDGALGRDDHLKDLVSEEILNDSQTVLDDLDDLCVLLLFSFDVNLTEEVNQVRRYRNWVAHGRRMEQPAAVDPATAYDRLKRFLNHFGA
jgi:hypothetical protein